ncbi:MAG: ATP-binding protein [Bacteroidia bacterium]
MIKTIRLRNWKSFGDAQLHVDPLTVLVGLNASGKSNLIDALRFLQRSANLTLTEAVNGNAQVEEIRGRIDMAVWSGESRFAIEVVLLEQDHKELSYTLEVERVEQGQIPRLFVWSEKLVRHTLKGARKKQAALVLFWTDPVDSDAEFITARIRNRRGTPHQLHRQSSALHALGAAEVPDEVKEAIDYVRQHLRSIFFLDPVPALARKYSPLSDTLRADGANMAGIIAGLPDQERVRVERALKEYVGQLPDNPFDRIYTELAGKFQQDAMLYGEERLPNGQTIDIDARAMSDGTLRVVAIMTAILTSAPSSLIVIEEVDNGIYPSKARLLLSFLDTLSQERKIDILVTTHNVALMDALSQPGDLLSFVSVVYRQDTDGRSNIVNIVDLAELPRLLSFGPLGRVAAQGLLDPYALSGHEA